MVLSDVRQANGILPCGDFGEQYSLVPRVAFSPCCILNTLYADTERQFGTKQVALQKGSQ